MADKIRMYNEGKDYEWHDLKKADLQNRFFDGANFFRANLRRAKLTGSSFCQADLRGADLRRTTCYSTIFVGADFTAADLRGADVRDASFACADFSLADLRDVKNLNTSGIKSANLSGAIFEDPKTGDKYRVGEGKISQKRYEMLKESNRKLRESVIESRKGK